MVAAVPLDTRTRESLTGPLAHLPPTMMCGRLGVALVALVLYCGSPVAFVRAEQTPACLAATAQGQVEGAYFQPYPTCVYKGIPFAQPPVGALRFAPPKPASPFAGASPFPAKAYGAGCMQHCTLQQPSLSCPATTDEDCLFLNVFTPLTSAVSPAAKRPVLVWIHGGNFIIGAGGTDVYHGSIFANRSDVVIVTINYRLGLFGGLFTTGAAVAGNFQLQDQQEALRWVSANIAAFGGDPALVTIMGQSAGGFSVAAHLSSPDSWPLFQRAIVESDPLALPTESEADAAILGDLVVSTLGCPPSPTTYSPDAAAAQLACLRNVSQEQLLAVQQATPFPKEPKLILHKFMPWTPVVRPNSTILPLSVKQAALTGQHAKVLARTGALAPPDIWRPYLALFGFLIDFGMSQAQHTLSTCVHLLRRYCSTTATLQRHSMCPLAHPKFICVRTHA